jgi:mono/diheme cytochrome c family protein
MAVLYGEGQVVFGTECVTCHAADGGEDMAPALSGLPSLANRDAVIARVLAGIKDMPSFAKSLNDRQIAAVTTYIRNAWGHAHGVVRESDVTRVRDSMSKMPQPPAPAR